MAIPHANCTKSRIRKPFIVARKPNRFHKKQSKKPVTGIADLDPLMVSLIADAHVLAR